MFSSSAALAVDEAHKRRLQRYGTTSLFAAFNILNGKVFGSCAARRRGREFVWFLNQLEKEVPADLEVHFILDNYYSTHKSAAVQRWLKAVCDALAKRLGAGNRIFSSNYWRQMIHQHDWQPGPDLRYLQHG